MKSIVIALLVGGLTVPVAQAQWSQNNWSPSQARDAVKKGDIKSLSDIYSGLRKRYGGKALDAQLRNGDTYQIRWETGGGRVLDLEVDARTGRVMSERGAG